MLGCAIFLGAGAIWRSVADKLGYVKLICIASCVSDAASVDAHFFVYFFVGLARLEAGRIKSHNAESDNDRLE